MASVRMTLKQGKRSCRKGTRTTDIRESDISGQARQKDECGNLSEPPVYKDTSDMAMACSSVSLVRVRGTFSGIVACNPHIGRQVLHA